MYTDVIIGAATTLAGAGVTGLIQYATTVRTARAERAERHRREVGEAAVELAGALVDHRRHQYLKLQTVREGGDPPAGRQERWEARSAVTRSMARLEVVAPHEQHLLRAAREGVATCLALGDATDETLDDVRQATLRAHDQLLAAAARATRRP
ncbi:hypothetical protein ACH4GK_31945 [Streptomyces rimosus]|uniref:hypothetical protein n=1 Tax=Streptomyces rimosus TaxID=1927 RepID=UPI0004C7279B|nr:hypothetical protein [Streptomyces rimosus]